MGHYLRLPHLLSFRRHREPSVYRSHLPAPTAPPSRSKQPQAFNPNINLAITPSSNSPPAHDSRVSMACSFPPRTPHFTPIGALHTETPQPEAGSGTLGYPRNR